MSFSELPARLASGIIDLPWWGYLVVALILTHITIVGVTLFLHRHQAHYAIDLHPVVSHFLRAWLWLTTGMITREWVAVHRKHHANKDKIGDPHSPRIFGINRVVWAGVLLYTREADNIETVTRYGHGAPNDWLERKIYSRHARLGVAFMGAADLIVFGLLPGSAIFLIQMVWIPFFAAGVINGLGHWFGYRNWGTDDASTNIIPFGILIGGEELHNNHHRNPAAAKLSNKWYEFDVGWLYISLLTRVGLARVRSPRPSIAAN
ncbi:MAG: DesA family fatty acid desaturase [Burkholderiales bacterium]